MFELYNLFIYQPIFNLLVLIYNYMPMHDMGLTIIALTILIKLALYPLSRKQIKAQKSLQDMQPKVEELKKLYKDDKQKLMEEQMKLFKEHRINPLSSCLPLLIQLPFLLAMYRVFWSGLGTEHLTLVYPFIENPGMLNDSFLGLLSLREKSIPLVVLAGAAQFFQAKMLIAKRAPKVQGAKDEDMAAIMGKQMAYVMPLVTIVIGSQFPAGVVLYWLVHTLITWVQQINIMTPLGKKKDKPEEEKKETPQLVAPAQYNN